MGLSPSDQIGRFCGARAGQSTLSFDHRKAGRQRITVPAERENALNAQAINCAADLPILRHNDPGRMGINMGDEFLDHVAPSRNFWAIKDSSGGINHVRLLAQNYPHVQMSCGMDDQTLKFFAWRALIGRRRLFGPWAKTARAPAVGLSRKGSGTIS